MIPEVCVRPWNRPQDMSFILDELFKSEYAQYIDTERIGAAGFSQGGIACFWLAGARAHLTPKNVKQQMVMMFEPEMQALHFKEIPQERLDALLDNFTAQDFEQANQSYYDARFKAVFSMAPGIDDQNVMFTEQGLAQVKTPTYIITGESDEGTIEQTPFFAHNIPYCTCTILSGQVTHWTLLNEGTEQGKINKPSRTVDDLAINREEVHGVVALEALIFFDKHL
jgi:predicted dienelactone hydrolase